MRKYIRWSILPGILFVGCMAAGAEENISATPAMGWSSWNTYHVDISDSLIRTQADAMVRLGLKDAGYEYINIDDGFFGGRDEETGKLLIHPLRFPNGLKPVADYIHSLGLKAGIYSDAGRNTCGNYYDNDTIAVGVGLYGHDRQDADFYFGDCGFDFIKIDFCGGVESKNHEGLDLDEKERYTAVRKAIDDTGRTDVRMNVCRWDFPGTWVMDVGDSWRISHDIGPYWASVKDIIDQNLYLSAYAGNGRYNDMDMLEVGRGLTHEEDKTHFGLWCVMNSPLMIGCDLNAIKPETLTLLTNSELIAVNQDVLGQQAYVVRNVDGVYLLVKDLEESNGNIRAIAVYNSTDNDKDFTVDFNDVCLAGNVRVRDLFEHFDMGEYSGSLHVNVPAHATKIMRLEADRRLPRVRYEAETAYLSKYQELVNHRVFQSATVVKDSRCSGAAGVECLGMDSENDLQWRDTYVPVNGIYECTLQTIGAIGTPFIVNINGTDVHEIRSEADLQFEANLKQGNNVVRLYSAANGWMPIIDYMDIRLHAASDVD